MPQQKLRAPAQSEFPDLRVQYHPWRSFEAVEHATLEWVDWFNNRRLLWPVGNIPPAEAEAKSYATLEAGPTAA
jgi:transposase InsO family protein